MPSSARHPAPLSSRFPYTTLFRSSAAEAGAPEFIELISKNNADMGMRMTGGLAWLDRQMEEQHGKPFVSCTPAQQTAMLDAIAYRADRKSTRLNSSHLVISYAVVCASPRSTVLSLSLHDALPI